jgi:alkylation response protein AidB-like acyl-CoA dehydrogenase
VTPPTSLLSAARGLRSTIDANAVKAGAEPVPHETVEALQQAGLFAAMTTRELGGTEEDRKFRLRFSRDVR